jgi:predicted site-specific integrase-resolvase
MEKDEIMEAKEVAQYLNISRTSLQRLIVAGRLKPVNPTNPLLARPKKLLFARQDVEALLKPPQS